jgi:hypothetical protein
MPELIIDYRSAGLKIEVDDTPSARLYINNILRAQESTSTKPCTLALTTTVQTDYEWHEFIEATISFTENKAIVKLAANGAEILQETLPTS